MGEVAGGRRHGAGALSFDGSPTVYEGEWRGGLRHGRGTLWFDAERTAYYEGGRCGARRTRPLAAPAGSRARAHCCGARRQLVTRAPPPYAPAQASGWTT